MTRQMWSNEESKKTVEFREQIDNKLCCTGVQLQKLHDHELCSIVMDNLEKHIGECHEKRLAYLENYIRIFAKIDPDQINKFSYCGRLGRTWVCSDHPFEDDHSIYRSVHYCNQPYCPTCMQRRVNKEIVVVFDRLFRILEYRYKKINDRNGDKDGYIDRIEPFWEIIVTLPAEIREKVRNNREELRVLRKKAWNLIRDHVMWKTGAFIGGFEADHLYSSKNYITDHIHFNFIIPCVGVDKKKNQLVFLRPYIGDSYTIDIEELKKQYGEYLSKRYELNIEKVVMNITFVKDKKSKKRGVKVLHHRVGYFLRSYNPEFFVYENDGSLSYVDKKNDIYMENLSDDDFLKILSQFMFIRGKLGKRKERVGFIKRYSWFGYLADNVWGDYKKLFGIGDEVKKELRCGKCNAKMMYAGSDYKGKIVTTSRWLLENDLYDVFKKWIDNGMDTTREVNLITYLEGG